jgi:hypothetical protein
MKKWILVLICTIIGTTVFAQISDPVKWTFSIRKVNATTYEIHMAAKIEDGWHLYSQSTPKGGAYPTVISFTKNPLITRKGSPKEIGKLESHYEPLFSAQVNQFSNEVDFVQTVTLKAGVKTTFNGSISFMTCNDKMCLPPKKQSFSVAIK